MTLKDSRVIWKELNDEGFPIMNKLINNVIQSKYSDEMAYWHPALILEFPNIVQKYHSKMNKKIDYEYERLVVILDRMSKQQVKMINYAREMEIIEKRMKDILSDVHIPLFKTCPIEVFVKKVQEIVNMFTEELISKKILLETKPIHISSQEEGISFISVWLNQPKLNDGLIKDFEDICEIELL
ncbi:unnamed protein product [Cunninghamella blakesleeana]